MFAHVFDLDWITEIKTRLISRLNEAVFGLPIQLKLIQRCN